uniref:Uncharacterized protein n=1 Tax=Oryza nivara TaxID=4536 RepID=A0A0E0G638_ORYNI
MIKERSIHRSAALILRLLSAFVVRDGAIEMHDAPSFCYFLLTFCFVNCGLLLYAMKNWTQSDQQLTKKSRVHGLLYFFWNNSQLCCIIHVQLNVALTCSLEGSERMHRPFKASHYNTHTS